MNDQSNRQVDPATSEHPPETSITFGTRFNTVVVVKHYYSRREQMMRVRIDINSKTIEGLGLATSIDGAKELIEALQRAVVEAEKFVIGTDDE